MAMTGAGLSAALFSALESEYDIVSPEELQKFCDAAGSAIVSYIQANAVVPAGITLDAGPYSGATTGTGTVT
jgi:hypothetical protein